MIAGIFHEGSGLGDQLFRYITVRTLAEEKGYHSAMLGDFKGDFFLQQPERCARAGLWKEPWFEKDVRDAQGNDIRSYDPEINFVQDNTIIDGSFEDSKYWGHNLENISKWLAVEPLNVPDDVCIVGFRGGEYASQPDLFLPTSYYEHAIMEMHKINPNMRFEVHSDDPKMAELMLTPIFGTNPNKITYVANERISHSKHTNMALNWRSARYAKYAIIPNSAFFIIPRILKHFEDPTAVTIAPRYWARRNTKVWARPACWYREFLYI
jgi:hypothetical protein